MADLPTLNQTLEDRSYLLGGFEPTKEDFSLVASLPQEIDVKLVNVRRWSKHIRSFPQAQQQQQQRKEVVERPQRQQHKEVDEQRQHHPPQPLFACSHACVTHTRMSLLSLCSS